MNIKNTWRHFWTPSQVWILMVWCLIKHRDLVTPVPQYPWTFNPKVLVEEQKTNLMSLAILFHFLCTQHVSDINISIIRNLRLFCWITTFVVLLEISVSVLQAEACNTDTTPTQPHRNLQHTSNQEQYDQCGNSTAKSKSPDDGYINVRNMLST